MLSDLHKTKLIGSALQFVTQYNDGDVPLRQIVIGSETWVFDINQESKQQFCGMETYVMPEKTQVQEHEKSYELCSGIGKGLACSAVEFFVS